jgi:hypothetical protein
VPSCAVVDWAAFRFTEFDFDGLDYTASHLDDAVHIEMSYSFLYLMLDTF